MLWKLFLPLISPCSSSVAVLVVTFWKRANAEASSQSWHGRLREVSALVALGELTEMVLWLRHWELSLKKRWRPAVKSSWSKKRQLQKQWAALSWENLWASFCPPLSWWLEEVAVTSPKCQLPALLPALPGRLVPAHQHQGRSWVQIPPRTEQLRVLFLLQVISLPQEGAWVLCRGLEKA